ncbi:MAG: 50S ribosomal protein L30 [Candidatus Nezhaarchaeales archaeon]
MVGEALLCVIRLRGKVGVSEEDENTLKMLRLHRKNHAVLVKKVPSIMGMLLKVSSYITYGEVDLETLTLLLKKRGRLIGDKPITDEYAKKLGYENVDMLAKSVYEQRTNIKDLPKFKQVFRLHPPSKGFKGSIKKRYGAGGELGYRGTAINELLKRMI